MEANLPKNMTDSIAGSVILVTGGAGFVGSAIVDALLLRNPREIRVLDRTESASPPNLIHALSCRNVTLLRGDVRNQDFLKEATAGVDYIFHQAGLRVTKCQESPRASFEILIEGTFNLLEAAAEQGVKKIVAASSAIVYGRPQYLPVDELHPLLDRTMYGVGKITNEQLLEAFFIKYHLPYIALRYFNVYGPRMNLFGPHTEVLVKWLDRIGEGEAPLILGDGKQTIDMVFIDDVVRANLLALESPLTNDVFNVGTGRETSLNELAKLLLHLTASPLEPEHREAREVNQLPRRFADTRKASQELGFQARVPIEKGLKELIAWRTLNIETLRKSPF